MKLAISTRILLICLFLSYYYSGFSQLEINLFTDVGSTNVTQEYFLKSAQ